MSRVWFWSSVPILTLVYGCASGIDCPAGYVPSVGETHCVPFVDPEAPSAPEITIAPSSPRTADTLVASITRESTDPKGGAVRYEYRWLRDGAETDARLSELDAQRTARGETWSVEVTPIAESTGKRGLAASTSVTIDNTPPVLTTVGLSTYRPIEGERVAAIPGSVSDPDGDEVAFEYVWYVNEARSRETGSAIDMYEAGSTLRLVTRAYDGVERGPEVTVGPVQVIENTTRWRELLPSRLDRRMTVLDETHRRILVLTAAGSLWEYALDEGRERFVKLFPRGQGPGNIFGASAIYDVAHQRVLMWGGEGPAEANDTMWQLDVSRRGAERWSVLAPGGEIPGPQRWSTVAYARKSGRVYVVGGRTVGSTYEGVRDVWSLDVSTPGAETWTKHAPLPTQLHGATLLMHPDEDRAYVMGGVSWDLAKKDPDTEPVSDAVYRMNLGSGDVSFEELDVRLPRPLAQLVSFTDAARNRGLVAFGSTDLRAYSDEIYAFDFASESFINATTTGGPSGHEIPYSFPWYFLRDPVVDRALAVTSNSSVFALDLVTKRWSPLTRSREELPPSLSGAAATSDDDAMTIFGGMSADTALLNTGLWKLHFADDVWEKITALPDEVTGSFPSTRYENVVESNTPLRFFSGAGDSYDSPLQEVHVWELDGARWVLRRPPTGTGITEPTPRYGASFFDPSCDEGDPRVLGFFGGWNTLTYLGDTGFLVCDNPTNARNCRWELLAQSGAQPTPRARATVARTGTGEVVLFGGYYWDALGNDLWMLPLCSEEVGSWHRVQARGGGPRSASYHTMTLEEPLNGGGSASFLVFGGLVDGDESGDVWRLVRLDVDSYEWARVIPAPDSELIPPRGGHVAVWDRLRQRLLVYGGSGRGALDDLWELRLQNAASSRTAATSPSSTKLTLASREPGTSRSR